MSSTTATTIQHKTLDVIIRAVDNGKKLYEHDGENVSILVSNEDYRFLRETSGTLNIDELTKRSEILNNALKRLGLDSELHCVYAMSRENKAY